MKNPKIPHYQKYSKLKIVERGKIDTPSTRIHDHALSWLRTGTLINSGRLS